MQTRSRGRERAPGPKPCAQSYQRKALSRLQLAVVSTPTVDTVFREHVQYLKTAAEESILSSVVLCHLPEVGVFIRILLLKFYKPPL